MQTSPWNCKISYRCICQSSRSSPCYKQQATTSRCTKTCSWTLSLMFCCGLADLKMVIWLTMIVWKALLESFSANCALYVGGYLYLLTTEWTKLAIPPTCTYVFVHQFEQPKGDSFLYPMLFILHGHWKMMWMHACSVLFQDACAQKGLQSLFNCYTTGFTVCHRDSETHKFLRIGYRWSRLSWRNLSIDSFRVKVESKDGSSCW